MRRLHRDREGKCHPFVHHSREDSGGVEITTLEGLGTPANPHPLQQAFIGEQAAQCGFCVSGIIMTAKAFLDKNPESHGRANSAGDVGGTLPLFYPRPHARRDQTLRAANGAGMTAC